MKPQSRVSHLRSIKGKYSAVVTVTVGSSPCGDEITSQRLRKARSTKHHMPMGYLSCPDGGSHAAASSLPLSWSHSKPTVDIIERLCVGHFKLSNILL